MFWKTSNIVLIALMLIATGAFADTKALAAKTSKTPFKISPIKALNAAILRPNTDEAKIPATELDLLEHASKGDLKHWPMAKAALVISGVTDESELKQYLAQLKEISLQSKGVTASAHSPMAKAKALGKFLHDGPMHGGYLTQQYDLRKLLETGQFNCVSSAVLYNMMAAQVGIEVRAVVTPIHVFSRALDFDVEPTSGRVFPIGDRTDRVLRMNAKHGDQKVTYEHELFRETNNLGLLSAMYMDDAGNHSADKDYSGAVICYLKAACFDPTNPSIVKNLNSVFKRWIALDKKNHNDREAAAIEKFRDELFRQPTTTDEKSAKLASAH